MQTKASKTDRWVEAAEGARTAFDDLSTAFEELLKVQAEIAESYDNMGEGLQQTERGFLYETITCVDLCTAEKLLKDLDSVIGDAEMIR